METLGKRLQYFRLENGWSKRAVAKRLGVSIPSIMRWEEDRAEPTDSNRYKIERLLADADTESQSVPASRQRITQLSLFSTSKAGRASALRSASGGAADDAT